MSPIADPSDLLEACLSSSSAGVKRVHAVAKTHLDVGFTDQADVVVDNYVHRFLPRVIEVNRQFEAVGRADRYVWTTGSWLIWESLERSSAAERALLEQGLELGWIVWHGMPFTTHTEFLTRGLMERGLRLSSQLDERFGKRTIAAKLTDVPGHTRALVPLLVDHGIEFLHIGINEALHAPLVPELFRWVDDDSGAGLTVAFHQDYGGYSAPAGVDSVLDIEVTSDNVGPSSPLAVFSRLEQLRRRYPLAEVNGSTLDAFAVDVRSIADELPEVHGEIGDTWIYGVGSDPRKVRDYRELARRYDEWSSSAVAGADAEALDEFARRLMLVGEHTWGLDTIVYQPTQSYDQREFELRRSEGAFRSWEASWNEQRGYIKYAIAALPAALADQAKRAIDPPPVPDAGGGWQACGGSEGFAVETAAGSIKIDRRGAVIGLTDAHCTLFEGRAGLGAVSYQVYGDRAYESYRSHYVRQEKLAEWWIGRAFGKYALAEDFDVRESEAAATCWRQLDRGDQIAVQVQLEVAMAEGYGIPRGLSVEYSFDPEQRTLDAEISWQEKSATLRPEAMWVSFEAPFEKPTVAIRKLGRLIGTQEVLHGGASSVHATDGMVKFKGHDGQIARLEPLDSSLIAVGDRRLLTDQGHRAGTSAIHSNLFNNLWGTNFPQWIEGPQAFRFALSLAEPRATKHRVNHDLSHD